MNEAEKDNGAIKYIFYKTNTSREMMVLFQDNHLHQGTFLLENKSKILLLYFHMEGVSFISDNPIFFHETALKTPILRV